MPQDRRARCKPQELARETPAHSSGLIQQERAPCALPHAPRRHLGHTNLGTTTIYVQGIDTEMIIATVHARRAPKMSATAGRRL
jgi:hypothetical protein